MKPYPKYTCLKLGKEGECYENDLNFVKSPFLADDFQNSVYGDNHTTFQDNPEFGDSPNGRFNHFEVFQIAENDLYLIVMYISQR